MKTNLLKAAAAVGAMAPFLAFATAPTLPGSNINSPAGAVTLLCTVAGWAFVFLVILAVIFVLYAAFLYLTAAGDDSKIKQAGSILIYAAVAIAVALFAKGFPQLIGGILGGGTINGC